MKYLPVLIFFLMIPFMSFTPPPPSGTVTMVKTSSEVVFRYYVSNCFDAYIFDRQPCSYNVTLSLTCNGSTYTKTVSVPGTGCNPGGGGGGNGGGGGGPV